MSKIFKKNKNKKKQLREDFIQIADCIVNHEEYQKMKDIEHHSTSVFAHSVSVAYYSYIIADKLGFDKLSTARGGLLHDFFLYKFSEERESKNILVDAFKHTLRHPKEALKNSEKHFDLNHIERNIIKAHMFPVGLPKSPEAVIVSMVDKFIAIYEYALNFSEELEANYELKFSFS